MRNLFGTDGIRGRMGTGIFIQHELIQLGQAIALWAQKKYSKKPHILIFHDTRISASFVKAALKTGLLHYPVILEDAGVLPTPAAAHLMKLRPEFDCALVISASHNPYDDNGIKIIDAQSGKLTRIDEETISSLMTNAKKTRWFDTFCLRKTLSTIKKPLNRHGVAMSGFLFSCRRKHQSKTKPKPPVVSNFEKAARGECFSNFSEKNVSNHAAYGTDIPFIDAQELYCTQIINIFPKNFLAGKRIVLDTAHGATYEVAPQIFKQLGAKIILINHEPTGYNINENCGALHTQAVADAVKKHAADAGFAFDGDGDRVMAINRQGQLKDGDDMLALLLEHANYQNSTHVVGTIMSNEGFAQHVHKLAKLLVRTAVGDKYIAEKLISEKWLLGGEPSGHIILQDIVNTGDGILVALRLLETLCATNNWDMNTFERYPQVMINVPVAARRDLEEAPLKTIIANAREQLSIGRVLVRYSGTENVLRVMVETASSQEAHLVCQQLAQQLSQALY